MSNRDPWTEDREDRRAQGLEDLARADRAIERRKRLGTGLVFRSVDAALEWFWAASKRMRCAQSPTPRVEHTQAGEAIILDVDGGRGGDLDEVLATLATIRELLEDLQRDYQLAYRVVVLRTRDGETYREIARALGVSSISSIATEVWRAEAYLLRALREAGLLV